MNKKIKLLLSVSTLIGTLSVIPKEANATLRSRIGNALARVCGSCIGRGGNRDRALSSTSNNLQESSLNQRSLINNDGVGSSENLRSNLNQVRSRMASFDSSSLNEPNVNQRIFLSGYVDDEFSKTIIDSGNLDPRNPSVPRVDLESLEQLVKTKNESDAIIKNLTVSSNLETRREELLKKPLIGAGVETIDRSLFDTVEHGKYYHQHKEGNKIVSLVSESIPEVIDTPDNGKKVETIFMDNKGEIQTLITPGLPIWLKGSFILSKLD